MPYSSTENIVGTYENGKPIYRRKISLNNIALTGSNTFLFEDLGLTLNIDDIIDYYGIFKEYFNGNYLTTRKFPLSNLAGTQVTYLHVEQGGFTFKGNFTSSASTTRSYIIYIEYTKTTD